MIFILSIGQDESTNKVISFLRGAKHAFRWNQDQLVEDVTIALQADKATYILDNGYQTMDLHKLTSFWYRRGDFRIKFKFHSGVKHRDIISKKLLGEWEIIKMFLHNRFKTLQEVKSPFEKEVHNNKIEDLHTAQTIGLSIPETLVTSRKKVLLNFLKQYPLAITKPLSNAIYLTTEEASYSSGASKVIDSNHLDQVEDSFFPMLIQAYVKKQIELRIFHLNGKNHTMAIFSQLDERTKIDYRNYNRQVPNRNVPYALPDEIETKINAFMKVSELNTGSIDMILTPQGEYVFLEVNPIGQFDWVSVNCNYYLEKAIANYLTDKAKNNEPPTF